MVNDAFACAWASKASGKAVMGSSFPAIISRCSAFKCNSGADSWLPEDVRLTQPQNVVVLSHAIWHDHFLDRIGRFWASKFDLDSDIPFTVVGVAVEEFLGTTGDREVEQLFGLPLPAMQSMMPNDPGRRAARFWQPAGVLLGGRWTARAGESVAGTSAQAEARRVEPPISSRRIQA